MPSEPNNRAPIEDPPSPTPGEPQYRTYRATGGGTGPVERPYRKYRSVPRGLRARLRGEEDIEPGHGRGAGDGGPPGPRRWSTAHSPGARRWWRPRLTPWRVLAYLVAAVVAWLALSFVLFVISAEQESGSIPKPALAALSAGGNMLTSTDTVLVLGTDQRPKGTHEAGADTSDKGSRSDTIMLWRIGGGTSRRLSIPRDTLITIPGYGHQKINAAYAIGGPALAIKTIEAFTGVKINHLIIVNLANFPKFIDAIGGITVHTGRICSNISGGAKNGGFTLDLRPGTHHLDGIQALTLARTRENACNAASNDLTREGYQ
ncbi:MAG: LCP family protein, partial [Solirubrobacteraceae bacterium]